MNSAPEILVTAGLGTQARARGATEVLSGDLADPEVLAAAPPR